MGSTRWRLPGRALTGTTLRIVSRGAETIAVMVVAATSLAACGDHVIDAVGLDACDRDPIPPGCVQAVWPNEHSSRNSDEWLRLHHEDIQELRPRVLVLQFNEALTVENATAIAQRQIAALAEGSRYHGYSNPDAPAMLKYQLAGVVDLADHPVPAGWTHPSSTLVPTAADGSFDETALFSDAFAGHIGIADPLDASRHLSLCELFERGAINEVWLLVGEPAERAPTLMASRKQVYGDDGQPLPSVFDACTVGGANCLDVPCGVTVRLAHLSPDRGVGCDLEVRGWEMEGMGRAVPYMRRNASAFLNADFRTRFGTRFDAWDEICDRARTPCIEHPSQDTVSGTYADGTTWTIAPFVQGCGAPEFPPNASFRWDYASETPVLSRCEHYGMRDAADGSDRMEPFTAARFAAYNATYGEDCGGGWELYWRQSMPGRRNTSIDDQGRPMKSWWPFLFY